MVKPRRKLVTRGERELEKQRRASIASNASSVSVKDKRERGTADSKPDKLDGRSSPNIPRIAKSSTSGVSDKEFTSDKQSSEKDRARSLKRDDSKDRLNAIRGESPVKRPRKSETPPRSNMQEVTAAYSSSRRRNWTQSRKHAQLFSRTSHNIVEICPLTREYLWKTQLRWQGQVISFWSKSK
jgi:hypothetical protein